MLHGSVVKRNVGSKNGELRRSMAHQARISVAASGIAS